MNEATAAGVVVVVVSGCSIRRKHSIILNSNRGGFVVVVAVVLSLCLSVCTSHQRSFGLCLRLVHFDWKIRPHVPLSTVWLTTFVFPAIVVAAIALHLLSVCPYVRLSVCLLVAVCLCEVPRTWPEWISAWASFIFANYLWLKIYKIHEWDKPKIEAKSQSTSQQFSIIFNWKFTRELNFEPDCVSLCLSACLPTTVSLGPVV